MSRKPLRSFKLKVNEDVWLFKLYNKHIYEKMHGVDSDGITLFNKREVHLHQDAINSKAIAHEIFHIQSHYLYLDSTQTLKWPDIDEILAEWISENHVKFTQRVKLVLKGLGGNKRC